MAKTVSVAAQTKELLDEVNKDVQQSAVRNIQLVAKESVSKLKNTSPRKTGSYAKGWGTKKEGKMTVIVHNRTDYQLTHLLENGHAVVNAKGNTGKRAAAHKHIEPVYEWAQQELVHQIEMKLGRM